MLPDTILAVQVQDVGGFNPNSLAVERGKVVRVLRVDPVGDRLSQFVKFNTANNPVTLAASVAERVLVRCDPIRFDHFECKRNRPLDPAVLHRDVDHVNQTLASFAHLTLGQSLHFGKRQLASEVANFAPLRKQAVAFLIDGLNVLAVLSLHDGHDREAFTHH